MNKSTKKWLIAAASLMIIGAMMFTAVMMAYRWDFSRLSTEQFETNAYEVKEDFDNIQLNTETSNILFSVSDNGLCRVVCREPEKVKHSVTVQNGTLIISAADSREWHDRIGINLQSPEVTVYLPKAGYETLSITGSTGNIEITNEVKINRADISISTGNVDYYASGSDSITISTSTGNIKVSHISAGALNLSSSTGEIEVSDVTCKADIKTSVTTGDVKITTVTCQNLVSGGSTGNIVLKNTAAAKMCSVERTTGDVLFDSSDAAGIFVKTGAGNISGSLLSEKIFVAGSEYGTISVPKSVSGGKCEMMTSTGDIHIELLTK